MSAGANVQAEQRMIGRASAAMTLDVHADHFDNDLDTAGKALKRADFFYDCGHAVGTKAVQPDPSKETGA